MKFKRLMLLVTLCFASRGFAQTPAAPANAAQAEGSAHVFTRDMTVYVRDFELDSDNVKVDSGVAGNVRPHLLERPSKRAEHDPQAQAKKLVDTMSENLIKDLDKAGYKTQRLGLNDPAPGSGAMVSGVFTEVDEGNQLHAQKN
jgi:predicted nuclease of restriction endonuclease-like RecB superfamily